MKTHRDCVGGPSGRREVAGDAAHRQTFPTHADGPHTRSVRRPAEAFGPFGVLADPKALWVAHGSRCPQFHAARSQSIFRAGRVGDGDGNQDLVGVSAVLSITAAADPLL